MIGAVQTGCFVMTAAGAFYLLSGLHEIQARTFLRTGVVVGLAAAVLQLYPTGDEQGRLVATHQPVTLAAMEGLFHTERGAPIAIVGQPDASRPMLWVLMLSLPLPYIANTAGWTTAELGRQPWIVYGLMRTASGPSPEVAGGNVWFTLIGFAGTYPLLSVLFLFLVAREIAHGPEHEAAS
jgi:cytochrome bd-type quinol oxidase subunit 1